ncbi:MAG TPA: DMT family transporter [Herpetosiphonaceae bacterium]|nr:DMT family transporter [Herpetosiphonaceae bacterium]
MTARTDQPTSIKRVSTAVLPTVLALIFCFFWSSAFAANKINLRYAPPIWNLTVRCTVAGLIMLLLAFQRKQALPRDWRSYGRLALFGCFNTALYMLFTLWGLQLVSAGTAAIIASTHPLVLTLIAPVALKEAWRARKLCGVLLGFSGIWFVMITRIGTSHSLSGMAWVAAGVLSLIIGTLLFKRYPLQEPLLIANSVQLVTSALLLLPFAVLESSSAHVYATWQLVAGLSYVTLGVNTVGMTIWLWLLQRGEASKVSAYFFLTPIIGLAISAVLLGDHFGLRESIGLMAVGGGIFLVNRE